MSLPLSRPKSAARPRGARALFMLGACSIAGVGGCSSTDPLEIVTSALADVHLGASVQADIVARGGNPPYSFKAVGLPDGWTISLQGGLSGVAHTPGVKSFVIEAYDSSDESVEKDVTIHVLPDPLHVATSTLPVARQLMDYDQALAASGGLAPFRWSLAGGALPQGLELSADGRVHGTPVDAGSFTFTASVEDAEQKSSTGEVRLTVSSADPMIQTAGLTTARVGTLYGAAIAVEGGLPPYTFDVMRGILPPGLTLATDGGLAGTPSRAGDFTATVRVRDSSTPRRSDMDDVVVHVVDALQIRTTQLAQIIVNRPFDFRMEAVGGVPPYTWSIGAGTLPAGITFDADGRFSGQTAGAGDARLTVRVQDAEGFQAASLFTLHSTDSFVYEVRPTTLPLPRTCTATSVSYTFVDIDVPESYQISDVNVAIDIDYTWDENASIFRRGNDRTPGDPRIVLFAPDGSQAPLCGNGASVPAGERCSNQTSDLRKEYDDEARSAPGQGNRPERPLSVFDGMNAQGTWRLAVAVTEPTCAHRGTINLVRLTIEDDRSPDPYVRIDGFRKNNMATDPFVRTCTPRCSGMIENELFLHAVVYDVGPNGRREGGRGDDVAQATPLTWTWQSGQALPGITLEPNGHVTVHDSGIRTCSGAGNCWGTGQRRIIVSGGGFTSSMELLVLPPEWNRATREY